MSFILATEPTNGGTLNFGNVPVLGSATLNVSSRMTGGINGVSSGTWQWAITGPNASEFTPNSFTQTEDQGDPANLNAVTFAPLAGGTRTATLTITSTDFANTPIVIHLTGAGAAGGTLTLIPQTTNDFGNVKDGTTSVALNILAINNSGTNIIVTALYFDGTSGPIQTEDVNNGGSGYVVGDTGTINGGAIPAVYVVDTVSAGAVATYHLTNPGAGYVTGTAIATTKTSGVGSGFLVDINSIVPGEFFPAAGQPTLPFTLLANNASGPTIIPVQFEPSQTGFVMDANALIAVSNATNSPTSQLLQGTGYVVSPAYIIADTPRRLLLGYVDSLAPTILEADPDDLDTEEMGYITSVYDYDQPLYEKYLNRHVLRAEDLGTFGYAVTMTTKRQAETDTLSGQGGAADGSVSNYFADLGLSDDLIQVEISRAANDGPMSITQIFHEVERRGEQVEGT